MEYFLIIFSFFLAFVVLLLLWRRDKKCAVLNKQRRVKEERKQKILEFMEGKKKVSNKKIRELLGVTKRTVVRYMDDLEKEGRVQQVGKTGKHTYYKLK